MSVQAQPRLTVEQYLELERAAEFRHEYYDGRMYAMPCGTYNHARIIANFAANLHGLLRKRPCAVLTSEMRIRVSPEGLYTYPDIVVVCGEPKFGDGRSDTLENPTLLIEVLSPSTEAYDRGFKAEQYRKIETLKEYALVSQFSAHVEVVRRHENGRWLLSEYSGVETACQFESVDCSVALSDVYEGIPFASMEADIAHPSSFH